MGIIRSKDLCLRILATMLFSVLALLPAAALPLEYVDSALWTRDRDCEARGDTLLVTLEYGLQIWDLGDPALPVLLSEIYLEGQRARSVESFGDLAAVTTNIGSLYIVDIADPAAPSVLGSVQSALGGTPDVALVERNGTLFAYTAGKTSNGLRVYDLSNPALPAQRGTLNASGLESLASAGDLVLALSQGGHLRSVDASDPDHLVQLDLLDLVAPSFQNVALVDTIAVVSGNGEGFFVIDVSDPANLALIAQVRPTVNAVYDNLEAKEVILHGGLLYVATDLAGPLVYDMTDPANPVLVGYDAILDSGLPAPYGEFFDGDLAPERNRLYLCNWDYTDPGTLIFDVTGTEPLFSGRAATTDFTRFAAMGEDLHVTCNGESGLYGFHLVGGQLERRGRIEVPEMWGAEVHGNLVYAASTSDGLLITDWTDALNPQIIGSLESVGQARYVVVRGDVAYVAAYVQGLNTVDVSDPANPVLLDRENPSGISSARLDVAGSLAATADLNGGVNFWNVEDPADIVRLGNYDVPQKIVDVKLHGYYAYVAVSGDSIHVLNISDPLLPFKVKEVGPKNPTGFDLIGRRLLVSAGAAPGTPPQPGGVYGYMLNDPLNPEFLYSYFTTGTALAVASRDELLLVADDSAVTLLGLGSTGVGETPLAAAPPLVAWPNPFNPRTDLRFSLAATASGTLDVFDVSGRHLRRLAEGNFAAGEHQFAWDGTDEDGRGLPSGVYFARFAGESAAGGALTASRKLVLLR